MNLLFKPKDIRSQVIIITGATSGIGLATAKLAAKKGAKVVLSSRNEIDLKECVTHIKERGGNAIGIPCDVTILLQLENLRDRAIAHYGHIDTWVNNAGAAIYGYLMDTNIDEERRLFEINYWAVRNCCHIAVGTMGKFGGTIINIGGEASERALPILGNYSATQHAVKAYTDALRIELEDRNVPMAICLVRPGAINTPFPEHAADRLLQGIPSLPSELYDPIVAAEAIVRCASYPERDVYVGGPSRLNAALEILFPEMSDQKLKSMIKELTKGTSLTHHEVNEGLFHAPGKEGQVRGVTRDKVRLSAH